MPFIIKDKLASSLSYVTEVWSAWDKDKDGMITQREFVRALCGMGFSRVDDEVLSAVFDLLDRGGCGALSHEKLSAAIAQEPELPTKLFRAASRVASSSQLLSPEAGSEGDVDMQPRAPPLFLETAVKQATVQLDSAGVGDASQSELWRTLQTHANELTDLFRSMDVDGDGVVSPQEFRRGVVLLGYSVPSEVVHAVFTRLDQDASGTLTPAGIQSALHSFSAGAAHEPRHDTTTSRTQRVKWGGGAAEMV